MRALLTLIILTIASTCQARALDEVNYWREKNGLPPFKPDTELMEFAQNKAEYRAKHRLHDDHGGPMHPEGYIEGTGETLRGGPFDGWLTCAMENEAEYAGAGIATDGKERYMVLILKTTKDKALISPYFIKTFNTSFLTPALPIFP